MMGFWKTTAAVAAITAPFTLFGQEAHASNLYLKVGAGETTNAVASGVHFQDGMAATARVGTSLGPLRVEGGVDRLSGDLAGGVINGHALDFHGDANLDFNVSHDTAVYAGAGLDYVRAEAQFIYGGAFHADGYGWNWHAGVSHRVSDHVIVDAEWREVTASLSNNINLTADEALLSLRVPL